MNERNLNIMIIDDNPAIHQDFIKILTSSTVINQLNEYDKQLFDDDLMVDEVHAPLTESLLPKFIINTACQGREGVEKIKKSLIDNVHYALAFVDVKMPPGWDGIETIKHMWEVDPDIQVIICTAYSDYSWEETVQELGMGDNFLILIKPFDIAAVRQLASALTKKWILAKNARQITQVLQQTVEQKTESLEKSRSLLRSTLESSADGILVVDFNKTIIDCNSRFEKMWNIPKLLLKTGDSSLLFNYMNKQLLKSQKICEQMNHPENYTDESSKPFVTFKSGKILEYFSQPHCINGIAVGRVWSFNDITKRKNLEKKLEYQASHDVLTGLPNRVSLADRMQHLINFSQRSKKRFAVLLFDLDRFKLVNDSLSHEAGDKLLCLVARRLIKLIRPEDTLARIGGDEFVMIIPELESDKSIITFVNMVFQSLKSPFKHRKRDIIITTTIGISLYPSDGTTINNLLRSADLAMYQAKERGGNQFQFYTRKFNNHANKAFKLEADLRTAIENNEFKLLYQPQFNLKHKSLQSAEALIRWQHPVKGLLLPIDFIQTAEASGLIIQIGEWVIKEVCRQIKAWRKKGLPWIRIAVNVATPQLKQVNFADVVSDILTFYQIPPEYLELEITENVVITHVDIIQMINKLKQIGVQIVLDDFGTGNSSLNYLKQIPIDRLKIDKSFIKNISTSRGDEVIIEAIIAMGRSFHFKVLAEGVETQNQLNYLQKQLCDEVQGFLLSKPISARTLEKYLK